MLKKCIATIVLWPFMKIYTPSLVYKSNHSENWSTEKMMNVLEETFKTDLMGTVLTQWGHFRTHKWNGVIYVIFPGGFHSSQHDWGVCVFILDLWTVYTVRLYSQLHHTNMGYERSETWMTEKKSLSQLLIWYLIITR